MKINNIRDLCWFVWEARGEDCRGRGFVCHHCPIDPHNTDEIKLKGELEVVKECDHMWEYYTEEEPYNNKILRKCVAPGGCGLHDIRWFKKIDSDKLAKVFEE